LTETVGGLQHQREIGFTIMLVLYLVRSYYYARVISWLGFTIMLVLYCG